MYFGVYDGKTFFFFALNTKGKTLLSVLIGDPGKQDIREDCCCTDLRIFFFFCKACPQRSEALSQTKVSVQD